jgi:hypothetical protein
MLRSNILYRRLWYVKKRNTRKIQILFRISAAIVILSLIAASITGRLLPGLQNSTGQIIKSYISQIMSETVKDVFPGNLKYDDAVILNRSEGGSLNTTELNIVRLNVLSDTVIEKLEEKLKTPGNEKFKAQTFFNIEIQQIGSIETRYISEFSQMNVNRTKHSIFLEISIDIEYKGSLIGGSTTVSNIFPIAEAYIAGYEPQ